MARLEACHCGNQQYGPEVERSEDGGWLVNCWGCGTYTGSYDTAKEAEAAWNEYQQHEAQQLKEDP